MSKDYNKPETIIVDHNKTKIKSIFYGFPKNPIKWPGMKPIDHPGGYLDATQAFYDCVVNEKYTIPGGYRADHTRSNFICNSFKSSLDKLIPNAPQGCIYKEIVIEFEDGTKTAYSKWKTINIINWKI